MYFNLRVIRFEVALNWTH